MKYYLYLKTHNKTDLKYFGQTVQNPFQYKGSGTRWTNHLRKHGNNVDTKIIAECSTKEELKELGVYYSKLWNIVESKEFANCTIEEGTGGKTITSESRQGENNPRYGVKEDPATTELRRQRMLVTKNLPNYELYKSLIEKLNAGQSATSLAKESGVGKGVVCKLKNRTHGVFQAFPELV